MRLRHPFFVAAALVATPALAHDHAPPGAMPADARGLPDARPEWRGPPPHMMGRPMGYGQVDPRAREDWLVECRRRLSANDRGLGGAAIGGVVGGLLGNRIAGRGDRTVGTIAGAAVGAVAGAAIDKAEDSGRNRDECERILADHDARGAGGYAYGQGYGYPAPGGYSAYGYPAYGVPMMMVPVMMMPQGRENCREVVTYEYERVPVRRRHIHRVPDKRVRIAPDKRVRTN